MAAGVTPAPQPTQISPRFMQGSFSAARHQQAALAGRCHLAADGSGRIAETRALRTNCRGAGSLFADYKLQVGKPAVPGESARFERPCRAASVLRKSAVQERMNLGYRRYAIDIRIAPARDLIDPMRYVGSYDPA